MMQDTPDFKEYRPILEQLVKEDVNGYKRIGLLFSSGMDSLCLFFALRNLGIDFVSHTYFLEGCEYRDYNYAKKVCNHYNVPLIATIVPKLSKEEVLANIIKVMRITNSCRKVHVESIYPYLFMLDDFNVNVLMAGLEDSSGTNRRKVTLFGNDETPERFREDTYKELYDPNKSGSIQFKKFLNYYGLKLLLPYKKEKLIAYTTQFNIRQLNTPKQKMPQYMAYKKEIDELNAYRREVNAHLDIRDYFVDLFRFKHIADAQNFYRKLYKENISETIPPLPEPGVWFNDD